MTDYEQTAGSVKYSSALVWHFAEIFPNVFALYNYKREVIGIYEEFSDMLAPYRARPDYTPPAPRVKKNSLGIDLSSLDLDI